MAYSTGSSILASDINAFLNTARNVYATGSADRGYGQTAVTQANVAVSDTILASHWSNLISMVSTAATHQGTSVTLPTISAGSTIAVGSGLSTAVTAVDTNRLTVAAGNISSTSATAVTRSGPWGTSITTTITATWGSGNSLANEDLARFFFNSGGKVALLPAHPTSAQNQDISWNSFLAAIGTITVGPHSITNSGANTGVTYSTFASTTGYFEIGTANTTLISATYTGGGAYSSNQFSLVAQVVSASKFGTNGGNGSQINFYVTLTDSHANANYDQVQTGTTVTPSHIRATDLTSPSITGPTWTSTAFSGS